MNLTLLGVLAVFTMFAATLLLLEIGRRLGVRRMAQDPDGAKSGVGAVEGAVFGLMGLMIAFTFSGAAERFNARRMLIVEEANCIGTAWLRLDLLPGPTQAPLRETFRQYVDARLAAFRKLPDIQAAKAELAQAALFQNQVWTQAVAACRDTSSLTATMLLLPALNQMFDIATTRTMTLKLHPPWIIYAMLGLLVLAAALLAGYAMGAGKVRYWFHSLAFVLVISMALYVILDFEFPRIGLIHIGGFDHVLIELRESMKP